MIPLRWRRTRHCFLSRRKSLADVQSTDHINIRRYKPTTSLSAEDTTPNFNQNVWLQGRGKQLLHLSHGSRTRMPWKFQTVHTFWHSGLNNLLHLNKHLYSLPYWRALNWHARAHTHTRQLRVPDLSARGMVSPTSNEIKYVTDLCNCKKPHKDWVLLPFYKWRVSIWKCTQCFPNKNQHEEESSLPALRRTPQPSWLHVQPAEVLLWNLLWRSGGSLPCSRAPLKATPTEWDQRHFPWP